MAWNFCGLLLHLRVNIRAPLSDLYTVQTFTFFQGKCIQMLERPYLLPYTLLAATFCLLCVACYQNKSPCVPPLFFLKCRPTSEKPTLWSGQTATYCLFCLHREVLLKSKVKTTPFTQKKIVSISNSGREPCSFSPPPPFMQ